MPPIRGVALDGGNVTITRPNGDEHQLVFDALPANVKNKPIAQIESHVNDVWIPANLDFPCAIHIFTLSPLRWTVYCGTPGDAIPANWWED